MSDGWRAQEGLPLSLTSYGGVGTGLQLCPAGGFFGIPVSPRSQKKRVSGLCIFSEAPGLPLTHDRLPPPGTSPASDGLTPFIPAAWPPRFWEMPGTLPSRISLPLEPSFQSRHSSVPHSLQVPAPVPPSHLFPVDSAHPASPCPCWFTHGGREQGLCTGQPAFLAAHSLGAGGLGQVV